MSTWAELRQKTFSHLELRRDTTGDQKDAVDEALFDVYQDLITDINPRELFVSSSAFNLVGPAKTVDISTDLSVTDLSEIYSINVNTNPTSSNSESTPWKEISWESWIKRIGNLPSERWARSPDNKIHFSDVPATGTTWAVTMHYYKTPTAFADAGIPEINSKFHHLIAYGAATQFPQYFEGEREQLFLKLQSRFNNGRRRIIRERPSSRSMRQMRARKRNKYMRGDLKWA
jgi:hypothetical protein